MKRKLSMLLVIVMTCVWLAGCGKDGVRAFDAAVKGPGEQVSFGHYAQDADPAMGAKPISWTILDVQDGKALLLADKVLDVKPYNKERVDVSWETCTLRTWLNGEFCDEAFSEEERKAIKETEVVNSKNFYFDTEGGNNTTDRVFLLSLDEVAKYYELQEIQCVPFTGYWDPLGASEKLICEASDRANVIQAYTITEEYLEDIRGYGIRYSTEAPGKTGVSWWLRSSGYDLTHAACVGCPGICETTGEFANRTDIGVRPALWVDMEQLP